MLAFEMEERLALREGEMKGHQLRNIFTTRKAGRTSSSYRSQVRGVRTIVSR